MPGSTFSRVASLAPCVCLLLVLAACASGRDAEQAITETRAGGIISTGLRKVEELYYKETKASDLVAAGFAKAEEEHPTIYFTMRDGETTAYLGERVLDRFPDGDDIEDSHYWGRRIAAALSEAADATPDVTLEALLDSFMEGMVGSLHERASYIPMNRTLEDWNSRKVGDGGLNLGLVSHRSGWLVKEICDIGLREAGALQSGDIITEVDGHPIKTSSKKRVWSLLSGPVGSTVTLSVTRQPGLEPISLSFERTLQGSNTVAFDRKDRLTQIEVSQFSGRTAQDLRDALLGWASEERGRGGLILDLRDNAGGLLEASIDAAKLFLNHAKIAEVHGRHPDSNQVFRDPTIDRSGATPLVVLVGATTASGAEIVTAALQDAGRAVVVGELTHGAGTVQVAELFSSQARGLIPWGEITTPAGYRLDKRGVMPTVCTGSDTRADALLAELRSGGGFVDHAARTRDIDPDDDAAVAAFRALCPPRRDGKDVSLEVAVTLLEEPGLFDKVLAASQ